MYRFKEVLEHSSAELIVLCGGDMTFRVRDLDKFLPYADLADVLNGTRCMEQLRDYSMQLSTFICFGNFFVGKPLELKHLCRETFTDVGTASKLVGRKSLEPRLPELNPEVNLEFNAPSMDDALTRGVRLVECPIAFHPRVCSSKGGNVNNRRALMVGQRMLWGLGFA